jgi:hypothetical protein
VRIRSTEWNAVIDLVERRVDAHLEGRWTGAVASLLKTVLQVFVLESGIGMVLHASAVVTSARAIVFFGHSEAGKSTAASLACEAGAESLSDEAVLVALDEKRGETTVHTLPFYERGCRGVRPPRGAPLSLLLGLRHLADDAGPTAGAPPSGLDDGTSVGKDPWLEELAPAVRVRELCGSISVGIREKRQMLQAVTMAEAVVGSTPVEVLHFGLNKDFWPLVAARVLSDR